MKTIKTIALLIAFISLSANAQQYVYIHGHSVAGADSLMYVGAVASIDSMDFRTTLPTWTDDFNRGTLGSNWTAVAGLPGMSGTYLVGATTVATKTLYSNPLAIVKPGKAFTLAYDMYIDVMGDGSAFPGMAFDIQPDNATYQLVRNSSSGLFQVLATDNDGAGWAGVYASTGTTIVGKTWYRYTISSNGSATTLHIKVAKVSDNSIIIESDVDTRIIKGGKVGFFANTNLAWFDNFSFVTE